MKKILFFLLLCCLNLVAFGQTTTTIYSTGSTYTTGYINSSSASSSSLTRTSGDILIESYRTTSTANYHYSGYMVFDLSSIPAGSTISSVTFGYYVSGYTAGTTGTTYYTLGFPGDLSTFTDPQSLNNAIRYNKLGCGATPLLAVAGSTGLGSGTGNQTQTLNGIYAANWFSQYAGGKASICLWELGTSSSTRVYTISGYSGSGGSSTTATNHVPYLTITYTPPSTCSGAPATANAAISPRAGTSTTGFVLTLSGATVGSGITYQWKSSTSLSGTYTNISGATSKTWDFTGVTTKTYYKCDVTCSGSTTTSNPDSVDVIAASSCTPTYSSMYYADYSSSTTYSYGGMTVGLPRMTGDGGGPSLADSTQPNAIAYVDVTKSFNLPAATLYKGFTHSFIYRTGVYSVWTQCWIDYNNNGTFETTEQQGYLGSGSSSGVDMTISMSAIPTSVSSGYRRMRIVSSYYGSGLSSTLPPCPTSSISYGETRDYLVNIQDPPPAALASPASLSFAPTTAGSSSAGMTTSLTGSFLVPASGSITITAPSNYEVSSNGTTWVSSYTISYASATVSATTVYVRFNAPATVGTYTGNVAVTGGGLSSAYNIAVSGTSAAACSGSVTAGTGSASPASANATTPITLSVTGYTASGGITFQWQSASSSGGTYSNISGATNPTYSFTGITSTTYYQCVVSCPASSSSATTSPVSVSFFPSSSCTPAFYYGTNGGSMTVGNPTYHFKVNGASGTSIDDATPNTSSSATGNYIDETSTSYTVTLNAGTTYVFTTGNTYGSTMSNQVWIDFNNNGIFATSESVGGIGTFSGNVATFNVVIPAGSSSIVPGIYRMRVIAEYNYHIYPNINPCPDGLTSSSSYYGDIRDYKITLAVPPVCTASPTSLTFSPTTTGTSSVAQTSAMNGSYLTPASGNLTVTAPSGYDVSPDGSSWSASYAISYTGSTSSGNTIYVRFSPSAATTYTGNVTVTGGGITTVNIAVTGTGAAVCAATPTAGTGVVSPTSGSSGTTFNLSLSGATTAGGLTYQWESSTTGAAGSWTAISGATNNVYSFTGITVTMYYHCLVTCPYAGSTATSSTATATWVLPSSSCTPTFLYASNACTSYNMVVATTSNHFNATGASGTSIDDGTACNSSGYLNQTGTYSITLNAGTTYVFTCGTNASYGMSYQCWIDFNSNGTFETSESVGGITASSTAATRWPMTVNIPAGSASIAPGVYRMRIEGVYYGNTLLYPNISPCPTTSNSNYGEVRDYKVTLLVPPVGALTTTTMAFGLVSTGTSSSTMTSNLTGSYMTPSSGNLTVTAPSNFDVYDGTSWVSSYTISYTGGTLSSRTISVRFSPSAATAYSGNVTITGGGLSGVNIAVTGTGAVNCSGTPSSGYIAASPMGGISSTPFTLTCTGYSAAFGITFQWQSATSFGGTYTNISGATNATYSFTGVTANKYFKCVVTCSYSGSSATTDVCTINFIPSSSCTPAYVYNYCGSGLTVASPTYPFRINGYGGTAMNDNVGCSGTNYTDYVSTSNTVTLAAGSSYTVSVGQTYTTSNVSYQMWIDFNNDGTFQTSESVGGIASAPYNTVATFGITIPPGTTSGIASGTYRMRIEVEYNYHLYPSQSPCPNGAATYYYGTVRDYKVSIYVPPTAVLGTTSMTFAPTVVGGGSYPVQSSSLSGTFLTPSAGSLTVTSASSSYLVSPDGTTWASSYTVSYTGATTTGNTVYVQFNPASVATFTGNVTITGGGVSGANIAVSGIGATACSGTPSAGTVTPTPAYGSSSTAFVLACTGYSAAGGLTFQWQSSTTGATGSFSDISGATTPTYSFTGITATTYYQCVVTCPYSSSSATTPSVALYYFPASSCTPAYYYNYCSSGLTVANASFPFRINGYASTAMNDNSACPSGTYADYTGTSNTVTLAAGSSYTVSCYQNYTSSTVSYQMWIDFNADGTFQTSEMVGGTGTAAYAAVTTFGITIPSAATAAIAPGIYRMRIGIEYSYHQYPNMNPCPNGTTAGSFYYGQMRDYRVTIYVPPVITATPTTMGFPPTVPGGGSYTVLTSSMAGLYLTPTSGSLTVTSPSSSYQVSPDGSSWASSYLVSYGGGTTTGNTVYVRFNPASIGSFSGNVTIAGGSASTVNIAVSGVGAAACTGSPTAGTASSSPTAGGSATAFTLSCTGYSASGGIGFQWQSSADGTSWSDISGATLASYSFTGITANTYYRCNVTCAPSSSTTATSAIIVYYYPPSSCTPTWYYGPVSLGTGVATTTNHLRLNGFGSSIDDGTAPTAAGYIDQSATMGCTLNAGTTYLMTVGTGTTSYVTSFQAWLDFNADGIFQSSETIGGTAGSAALVQTFNVVTPGSDGTHLAGVYRMRVEGEYASYHTYPSILPCPNSSSTSNYYGEVRDYKITYNVPPVCSLASATMPFPPTTVSTSSSPLSTTFTCSFLNPASGNLTVTAPSNFLVYDGTSYVSSYLISYSGASYSGSIQAQFNPTAITSYSGNISISGGGLSSAVSNLNIAVTGNGAAACSGTPTAGISTISPTSGGSATSFTLTCSGYSVSGGIQFQWQSTNDTTTTWNDISGANLSSYTFTGITGPTYYRCVVTCSASSTSANTFAVKANYYAPSSCTPAYYYHYCSSGLTVATATYPFRINGYGGTSINDNTSGCGSPDYLDLSSSSYTCNLAAGTTYTVSCGQTYTSSQVSYQVWIDFNNDGVFQSTESVGGTSSAAYAAVTSFSITIPSAVTTSVTSGAYRLRIGVEYYYNQYPAMNPCPNGSTAGSFYYGAMRDYKVNIVTPPVGSASPTSLSFSPTVVSTSSASQSSILSTSFLSPASGNLTVTAPSGYEVSPDGTTWSTSYSLSYTGGTTGTGNVYVRFSPSSAITYSGNVTIAGGGLTTINIAVTGTGAAICSTTPTAGTGVVSPTSGSNGTTFNLSLSGSTIAGGLTYQWESSPSGSAGTWTAITGATNNAYSFVGISATTYYHCIVTCPYGGSAATSSTATATWVFPSSSCTPGFYYASTTCTSYGGFLASSSYPLRLVGSSGTINDANNCTGTGYSDYSSSMSCTLLLANSYTMTVKGSTSVGESYQAWIDFNSNGTFESTETVGGIAASSTTYTSRTFTITLPAGAGYNAGIYRLRVIGYYYSYGSYPGLPPCPNAGTSPYYYYGEVRDYKVIVNAPAPFASASPTSLNFGTVGASTTSSAMSTTVSAYYLTPVSGAITVTAPSNYLVSSTLGGSYVSSYTISYASSLSTGSAVYVKFVAPSTAGTYAGNVTITGGGLSSAYNIPVTGNAAYPCTGTPTAGTAVSSPAAGMPTTSFAITLTGVTVGLGMQYQWQSSTTGTSGSFSDVTGATNSSYSPSGLTSTTYYQCLVTCAYSGITTVSSVVGIPIYCVPGFYYGTNGGSMTVGNASSHFKVNGASGTSIDDPTTNTSSTAGPSYIDETGTSYTVTLAAGSTYSFTTGNTYGSSMSNQVWIDFNSDGVFQSSETVGGLSTYSATTASFNVTIPSGSSGVTPGVYRMRVIAEYYYHSYPAINPCPDGTTASSFYYGDIRDYKVTITVPPAYTLSSGTMAFPPTTTGTSSASISSTFTGLYLSPTSGTITVTAPTNFLVWDGTSFVNSYTAAYSGSSYTSSIQVQFNPTAVTSYSGNVTITGGGFGTATIAVSGTGAPVCSGTPTAGTVTATPSAGGSATSFTLSLSGYTALGGVTFQWQSSTDSTSWSDISGATLTSYTFSGLTASKYYRCNVTCTPSSTTVATFARLVSYFPPSSCTPGFYYGTNSGSMTVGNATYHFKVNGASGTSIDDPTPNTANSFSGNYIDETSTSYTVTLNAGTTYVFTTGNTYGSNMSDQVWIDFNNDGTFQTTESVGGAATYASTTAAFNVVIPPGSSSIVPGVYRMRVIKEYYYHSYPSINPCPNGSTSSSFYYGDIRDYKVTILVPPTATVSPNTIAFPPTTVGTWSTPVNSTLTAGYLVPASGNLTVSFPSGFDTWDGTSWVTSYAISYTGGAVTTTIPVYAYPTATTTYSGNVTVTGGGLSSTTIAVSVTGAPVCSGTPTAGTATVTPGAGGSSTPFTLAVTGYSSAGGITFQWQSTTDTTTSWTDITGATLATYSFTGITANKYYRCNVTCPASSSTVPTYAVLARYFPPSSCTPTFLYAGNACTSYGMVVATPTNHFKVNGASGTSIDDATACNTTGYSDQTGSYGCTLNAGATYVCTVGNTGSYGLSYQCWIDFNNDGTFQTSESVGGITSSSTAAAVNYMTITLPSGSSSIVPGIYRMRVESVYYGNTLLYPNIAPCPTTANSNYGEVRDYSITLTVPPVAAFSPASLTFPTTTVGTWSSALNSTLTASYLVPTSGNLTVSYPSGFDTWDGTSWVTSYVISYTGGAVSATIPVYAYPTSATTYTGNVTVTGGGLSAANIAVSVTGSTSCTTTPSAGTAASSPTSGSYSTAFTLSLSGTTVAGGLTYQWQSSPTGAGGTFTAISGATNPTYSFTGIGATTYYNCVVTCPYGGSAATSSNVTVTWVLPASTCTPAFYYGTNGGSMTVGGPSYPFKVNGASGTSINDATTNSSTTYTGSYIDETSTSYTVTLNLSTTYVFTTGQTYGANMSNQVWIDFNSNGTFESSESVGGAATFSTNATPVTVVIPPASSSVAPGVYRMRVIAEYYYHSYPSIIPCPTGTTTSGSYYYGDIRDYKVTITNPPPAVTRTPASLAFGSVVTGSPSSPMYSTITGSYLTAATGNLTITAPASGAQFKVCSTAGGTYVNSYVISYTGGTVASTPVYVQFTPSAATSYSGNVTITGGGLSAAVNIAVSGNGAAVCAATPAPGTASVSPSTGSPATAFTLSLSGTSAVGGLTFQWQSSLTGSAGSFVDITGATNASYAFTGISATTYYRCNVTCPYAGSTATSNTTTATFVLPSASCIPAPTSAAAACSSYTMNFTTVSLTGLSGTISDNAACDGTGYKDRTSLSCTLLGGASYNISLTMTTGTSSYADYTQWWIDFNSNGTFESSESVGGNTTAFNSGTVTITLPSSGITSGTYRMRGVLDYSGSGHVYPSMSPCMSGYSYGEARDYKVIVVVPSACAGTPTAGSISATATTGCSPVSSTLSLPATGGVTGLTYQWYSSTTGTGGSFSAISGATNATYASVTTAGSSATTMYYQCIITCTASGSTSTSSTQSITATPSPGAISGSSTVCVSGTTTLTNSLSGGTWSSSATGTATVHPTTGVVTGNAAGSCTISYTTTGCSPATTSFTVNGSPAAITGFTGICVGGTSTLHDATSGGSWSSSNTAIASVNASTGVVTAVSAGSATITYSSGCGTAATFSWTSATTPTAIVGPSSICTLSTATFTDTVTGGTWSNSPSTYGTIDATTGIFSASSSVGTTTLTYTIGYCSVTGTATVGSAGPSATISGTTTACAGASSTLSNSTSGGAWSSSTPSIATVNSSTGAVTGITSGSSTITYSTGCGTDATTTFTVNGSPVTISSTTACSQSTLNMTANVGAGAYTYSWTGPNSFTSTVQSPAISNASSSRTGIYSVTATQGGCSASTSYWVTVDTTPVVTVSASPASICPGGTSNLSETINSPISGTSNYAVYAIPYAPLTLGTVSSGPSGVNGNTTATIPFSFNYYGTSYTSVTISTNGYINFGSPSTSYTVVTLPSSSAPSGMISPFWHYTNAGSGTIKYATLGTAPNRKFVVRFSGVADFSGSGTNSGQIVLYETSNMIDIFVSQANTASTYSLACGIQNVGGTVGVAVPGQNNTNYVINNTVAGQGWRFVRPVYSYAWSPSTGLSSTTIANPVSSGLTSTQVYTVTAVDANSGCTTGNVSTNTVNVYTPPTAYTLSPSTGCTGVNDIIISSSEVTATYQLYRGASAVGSPVTGTGSSLNFGPQATAGTYTVVASLITGGCTTNMTGSSVISTSPTAYTVTGGNGCTASGVTIGLSNSQTGVSYQLYNGASAVGSALSGTTGSSLSWGSQTAAGTYTIVATGAGGCQTTMTGSNVISTSPTAYSVTGGSAGCSGTGLTIGVSNSQTGVSYQLYNGASAVGSPVSGTTGSSVSFGTLSAVGTYTVLATGSASCQTAMTGSAAITATPSISLGGSPSVCQPITSASISYSSASGSPSTYDITWGSSAISAGFSNVSAGTLSGGTISLVIPSTSVTGTYSGDITVSNGTCTSSTYSFTVTIYPYPTASISSITAPCMGYSTTVAFTGTSGADIDYTIDGGSTLTNTLSSGSYSFSSGAMTAPHTYLLVNAHNPACSTTIGSSVTVTPTPMQWTGATSTDWNDAANWACGFVPGSSDDAIVPSGTTNAPVIAASASGTTRNLTVATGATVTVSSGATLNVTGTLNSSGVVTGAGILSMDGTSAQTITGFGSVANFDVNNSAGVTVTTGARLTVKNVLSVTSGTLVTNDSVVLYSDTFGTARVAVLPASGSVISGVVQSQQFVGAGRRAYRFWGTPFSNSIPLSQLTPYIDITGPGGASNGFTTTTTNQFSAYRYNPLYGNSSLPGDPGWIGFTSAYGTPDSNMLHRYQGMRVFYRGAKGEGLGFGPYINISHTTITQRGALNQGNQNITLAKGATTNQDYNMLANPYASPTDIGSVIYAAAQAGRINGSRFFVWNPYMGTAGGFMSIPYSTCDCSSGGAPIPYYIQANDAFQVRALANGVALNFSETNKGATITNGYSLMKGISDIVALNIYDANYHLYDMLHVKFDDGATNEEDVKYDAGKPVGSEFNFYSLSSDNHKLSLDARPYSAETVIPLGVSSNYAQDFIIRTEQLTVPAGGKVYLHDKLLKQYVLLQQGTEYRFSVTKDNNTQGENRFELSMEPSEVAAVLSNKGLEVTMVPNPATDEVKISFTSGKKDQVNVRVLDLSGVSVYNQDLGNKQNGSINVPLSNFASGIYMVELTSGSQKVVQRLIKE